MNLNALSIQAPPNTNSVLYGNTIQVIDQTVPKPGPVVAPVEIIQLRLGCACYIQVTQGSAQAAPQWPPPPPLAGLRMLLPTFTDKSGYLVASSPHGHDDVIIPYFKWVHGVMPSSVAALWTVLNPVQQVSGLTAVDYHLFNITDPTSPYNGLTFAIPVNPAAYPAFKTQVDAQNGHST